MAPKGNEAGEGNTGAAAGADKPGNGNGKGGESPNVALASFVTVVALIVYLVAVIVLWRDADSTNEVEWAHKTLLLTGLEAITFAAIGWLFGREVHRARAEKAEQGESKAKQEADSAKERATGAVATGAALKRAIGTMKQGGQVETERLGRESPAPATDMEALAAIASYFPDEPPRGR